MKASFMVWALRVLGVREIKIKVTHPDGTVNNTVHPIHPPKQG